MFFKTVFFSQDKSYNLMLPVKAVLCPQHCLAFKTHQSGTRCQAAICLDTFVHKEVPQSAYAGPLVPLS